jgi:hypothetical protein
LLTAIFVANVPLTLLTVWALSFRIWPRYFFIDLGFIFLFVVHGVFVVAGLAARMLSSRSRLQIDGSTLGLLACWIAVICSLFLLPRNYQYPKQDFLGARDFVETAKRPGDDVATMGLAVLPFSRYYAPHWHIVDSVEELRGLGTDGGSTWLVYAYSGAMKEHYAGALATLESEFELVRRFPGTLGDGDVFVYRSLPDSR